MEDYAEYVRELAQRASQLEERDQELLAWLLDYLEIHPEPLRQEPDPED